MITIDKTSKVLLKDLVYPFTVRLGNAVDMDKSMPKSYIKAVQELEVKVGSLSETMLIGNPYYFHTNVRNASAKSLSLVDLRDIKCAIFENRSTTTQIIVYPFLVFGNSTIKLGPWGIGYFEAMEALAV